MYYPYAEHILIDAKCNQFFLQLYVNDPDFKPEVVEKHLKWFTAHSVMYQPVCVAGDEKIEGFYHIRFKGTDDPRLLLYKKDFELDDGTSLDPISYQMYEWCFQAWVDQGGIEEFNQLKNPKPNL